jgi:hypothetical protein
MDYFDGFGVGHGHFPLAVEGQNRLVEKPFRALACGISNTVSRCSGSLLQL